MKNRTCCFNGKKVLSLFTSAVMLCSALSVGIFAEDDTRNTIEY